MADCSDRLFGIVKRPYEVEYFCIEPKVLRCPSAWDHQRVVAVRIDAGEVGIPDDFLKREGPLDEGEQAVIRMHPIIGAQILEPFGEAAAFVRHHHERPDGRGYPDRLREDQIPIGAAVIGVAEAYDAMTSPRPYRKSRTRREALAEIDRLSGTQFVVAAADALLALPREQL